MGANVNQRQWSNLLQLLGLGSLCYGLYSAWSEYQIYAEINTGLNSFAQGLGVTTMQDSFMGAVDAFGYGLSDLILRSPWVWAGVVLILAPFLIGLTTNRDERPTSKPTDQVDFFVECPHCKKPIMSSAHLCQHCGGAV